MLNKKLLMELQEYVNSHLEKVSLYTCHFLSDIADRCNANDEFEDYMENSNRPTFGDVLRSFMDEKGVADTDILQRTGIEPGILFRIQHEPRYRPGKGTFVALAMVLELTKMQTDKLLSAAGYTLLDSEAFDLVVQFCLEREIYAVDDLNQALDYMGLKPLSEVAE